MTIRKAILTFTLSTSVTMLLQCCFTGVESTPRITDNDVTRQKIIVSPEMKFMMMLHHNHLENGLTAKNFMSPMIKLVLC